MQRRLKIIELPFLDSGMIRTIRILHPTNMEKSYPVLYMHDGQNLFENNTSYGGLSWGISETIEHLVLEGEIDDLIVVGIDNSNNRVNEYTPWKSDFIEKNYQTIVGGKGNEYMSFIIDFVMPYVEKHFNVDKKKPQMIAGSSLGALISSYIAFNNNEIFQVVGVFSLASWICEKEYLDFLDNIEIPAQQRYFISIGTHETSDDEKPEFNQIYLDNSRNLKEKLKEKGVLDILFIESDDIHHESAWRKRFVDFILWALPKS